MTHPKAEETVPRYIAEEAVRAYDAVAKELHGEFARLNFKEDNIRLCRLVEKGEDK